MQIQLELKDESKLDALLQLLGNLPYVEVRPVKNGVGKKKKKLTADQQAIVDDIREGLIDAELHRQGKIRLQTLHEFLEEIAQEEGVAA